MKTTASLLSIALVLVAAAAALTSSGSTKAAGSAISRVGIDMDVSANTARTLVASPQTCARVNQSATVEIDVFVDSVPSGLGISGYEFDLIFNSSNVHVTAINRNQLLAQAATSQLTPFGDSTSSDGSFRAAAVDFGMGIEPGGASEGGPGILARFTLRGQSATGLQSLHIQNLTITDDSGAVIPVDLTAGAQVAVNTNCPGTSTPTPSPVAPTASPTPQVPSPTPTPSVTAAPSPGSTTQSPATGSVVPTAPAFTPTATSTPAPGTSVTPTPTGSRAPSPPGAPTATPAVSKTPHPTTTHRGDFSCDDLVDGEDALRILRFLARTVASQSADCPAIGLTMEHDGALITWGDVDCSGAIDLVDVIKTLLLISREEGVDCEQAAVPPSGGSNAPAWIPGTSSLGF